MTGDESLKRTVRISTFEGAFAQVFSSLSYIGSVFVSKFALFLNATPYHLGLLAAISQFSQLFQLVGLIVTRRMVGRRKPTLVLAGIGRVSPLFVGFLIPFAASSWAIWVFLGLLLISCSFGAMSGNIWIAWVNDLIPGRIRGRFFSLRSQFHLAVGLVSGYICSVFIDAFTAGPDKLIGRIMGRLNMQQVFAPSHEGIGLAVVITAGAVVALIGIHYLAKQPDRPKEPDNRRVSEIVLEPLRNANFRKLLLFNAWWATAIGFGSAYWQPFMIQKLHMTTTEIILYGTLSSISMLVFIGRWGRFIDRYGNKTTMKIALVLGSINPALWCFVNANSYWLLWVEAVTSGLMWSGMGIVSTNFVLSIVPREKAQAYFAVYSGVSGLFMMTTTVLSGRFFPPGMTILGQYLEPEQVLFALTAVLRLTAEIPLQGIQEPRAVSLRRTLQIIYSSRMIQARSFLNKVFRLRV